MHIYHVRIGDTVYTVRPKSSSEDTTYSDWIKNGYDPLRVVAPGGEFRYRFDEKGKLKLLAPMEKGHVHNPFHEAEYDVIGKEKAAP